MAKYLLIPSAKLIPEELRIDFGALPSGMVPLRGRPALYYILKSYADRGFSGRVAVGENSWLIADYLERHAQLAAYPVPVGNTQSLAETVLRALDQLKDVDYLAIQFADTLIDHPDTEKDAFFFEMKDDLYRWTTFTLDHRGRIDRIVEKNQIKPSGVEWLTFVGVFTVSDPARFRKLLIRNLAYADPGLDAFYACVRDYYNSEYPAAVRARNWRDFGHLDTYYRTARAATFVNGRAFNALEVDVAKGTISKTSSRKAKLQAELDWYLNLPETLTHLAPRVLSCSSGPDPRVELEFYAYPALADAFLYGNWDLGAWEGVLSAVAVALDAMALHPDPGTEVDRRKALNDMYIEKTRERLLEFTETSPLGRSEEVRLNGTSYPGIPVVLRQFRGILERGGLLEDTPFCVIHGDLCLSNILYDRRGGFVRLVDPRGSFGSYTIHGDPRYDLAKLCHSIEGDYDLLVNGFFELVEHAGGYQLAVLSTPTQRALRELFGQWLVARAGSALNQVRLIESCLFLSMLPLHYDRPASQTAFLLRGLEMFWQTAAAIEKPVIAYA